jgi:hypothetical protein
LVTGPIGVVVVGLNVSGKLIREILVAELEVMKVPIVLKQGRRMKAIKIRTDYFERTGMQQYF